MIEKRTHLNYGSSLTIPSGTEVGVYVDVGCITLATIYEDDGATPAANPVIVDANGEFSYRAANGIVYEQIGDEPAVELRFNDGSYVGSITQEQMDAINALLANPPTGTTSGLLANRPAASATYRGQFYNCEGAGDDDADILTVCLLSSTGSYTWRVVSTMFGGPA